MTSASAPPAVHHPGNVYRSARDAIGNTPLIYMRQASEATGRNIYGKCEYANAAGGASVKARAAKWLIQDAEARGLKPGGTIVESTAGNTGIALASLAAASGYNGNCYPEQPEPGKEGRAAHGRCAAGRGTAATGGVAELLR
jgi:cysteine synthase